MYASYSGLIFRNKRAFEYMNLCDYSHRNERAFEIKMLTTTSLLEKLIIHRVACIWSYACSSILEGIDLVFKLNLDQITLPGVKEVSNIFGNTCLKK